jgi:ADP-ribose pyrophosphatase
LKDLTEKFVSGEDVYRGTLLHLRRDVVDLPDGSRGVREYIRHPGAVMIVPLLGSGRVVLERQFRYPHRREFIELPAGKLEPGEPPLDTARRELLEETGYQAAEWQHLGVVHTTIGYSDETIQLVLARRLTAGERQLDAGEFLEVLKLPFAEAIAMVGDGRITDSKSIAALLWVKVFMPQPSAPA